MAIPLTMDSLITDPKVKKGKFEVALDKETFNQLVRYIVLTNEGKGRNKYVNSLIADKLKDKILDNTFINLKENEFFYFNKNVLLKEKSIIASNDLIKHDVEEVFVVKAIPNNLDEFNSDFESYCYDGNKYKHAGVYILPKYKKFDEKYFFFEYDSQKRILKIDKISFNDLKILLKKNKKLFKQLTLKSYYNTVELERKNIYPLMIPFVMYSYHLNENLKEIKEKEENGEIEKKSIDYDDPIYYNGIFF